MLRTPRYLIRILCQEMAAIEAGEHLTAISAALSPWMEQHDRIELVDHLRDMTGLDEVVHQPMPVIEHNPQKAADWFRAMGTQVVESA